MAMGMVIGLPLGIPIGIVIGMIAIGPAIGLALGTAIGTILEKRYNPEPLPLSQEQEAQRKKVILALGGIFLLGMIMFILLLLIT